MTLAFLNLIFLYSIQNVLTDNSDLFLVSLYIISICVQITDFAFTYAFENERRNNKNMAQIAVDIAGAKTLITILILLPASLYIKNVSPSIYTLPIIMIILLECLNLNFFFIIKEKIEWIIIPKIINRSLLIVAIFQTNYLFVLYLYITVEILNRIIQSYVIITNSWITHSDIRYHKHRPIRMISKSTKFFIPIFSSMLLNNLPVMILIILKADIGHFLAIDRLIRSCENIFQTAIGWMLPKTKDISMMLTRNIWIMAALAALVYLTFNHFDGVILLSYLIDVPVIELQGVHQIYGTIIVLGPLMTVILLEKEILKGNYRNFLIFCIITGMGLSSIVAIFLSWKVFMVLLPIIYTLNIMRLILK